MRPAENLLFHNDFIIDTRTKDNEYRMTLSPSEKAKRDSFRQWYRSRYGDPSVRRHDSEFGSVDIPGGVNGALEGASRNIGVRSSGGEAADDNGGNRRHRKRKEIDRGGTTADFMSRLGLAYQYSTLRPKIVCIDSGDRNRTLFPSPSDFRIYLNTRFTSVRKIRLVGTEFPNVEQLIKSQPLAKKNNKIYWQNGPQEADHAEVYSITITDGNYSPLTFANELTTKTAAVERNLGSTIGKVFSSFEFDVNNISNKFTMRQNTNYNLSNPISTTANSPVVTVTQDEHNFFPGQIVNISGCGKVGGVTADALNASQVIGVYIDKVDGLTRVNTGTNTGTFILYGTTGPSIQGKVNATRGSKSISGHGTNFLEVVGTGSVVNIGYNNYVVENVIGDESLTLETPATESFDSYSLIVDLTSTLSAAFTQNGTLTDVSTIFTKLRNTKPVSANEINEDTKYAESINDLSLLNYVKMQSALDIYDADKQFHLSVPFGGREPTYTSFKSFSVASPLQNFRVVYIDGSNNVLNVVDAQGNQVQTVTVTPVPMALNLPQLILRLTTSLVGWIVDVDTAKDMIYLRPPPSGSITVVTIGGLTRSYNLLLMLGVGGPLWPLLGGRNPNITYGDPGAVMGDQKVTVPMSSVVQLDGNYAMFSILNSANTVISTIVLNQTTFSGFTDLINLINSTLISRSAPVSINFNTIMQRVIFTAANGWTGTFGIGFKQPTQATNSLGLILGFDETYIHQSFTIYSTTAIGNILTSGSYKYALSEFVNGVRAYQSNMVRGAAVVTNTSNLVNGMGDTYAYADSPLSSNISATGTLSGTLIGNISSINAVLYPTAPANVPSSTSSTEIFLTAPYNSSASFLATASIYTYYRLTSGSGGAIQVTDITGMVVDAGTPIEVEAGKTILFDLSAVLSHSIKIATITGSIVTELTRCRVYMFNGNVLQFTPTIDMASSYVFLYDARSASSFSNSASQTTTYFVNFTNGYINIGSPAAPGSSLIIYSVAPVINLTIGKRVYIRL